MIVQFLHITPN